MFPFDFISQAGITAVRRVRKSDNNRIARASGATIVNRTDELREEDVGTQAGLFEIKKVRTTRTIISLNLFLKFQNGHLDRR